MVREEDAELSFGHFWAFQRQTSWWEYENTNLEVSDVGNLSTEMRSQVLSG